MKASEKSFKKPHLPHISLLRSRPGGSHDNVSLKGMTFFAVIDHSGAASQTGLQMRNAKIVVLGDANAGTPIVRVCPSADIDLPLKILVWEDDSRDVWISHNSTSYLQKSHGFSPEPCKQYCRGRRPR